MKSTTYAVGSELTRPIERWEIGHRGDPGVETARTVRPHMRNAHSHLYWTGVGRAVPRVRFLLPISVKAVPWSRSPRRRPRVRSANVGKRAWPSVRATVWAKLLTHCLPRFEPGPSAA
jgi:hypothetical protein